MTQQNIEQYKDVLIKACYDAGKYQKDHLGKIRSVEYKGVSNIVTDIDKACEKLIIDLIKTNFKDHAILGEESGAKDSGSEYKWIIDPLDGTTNFTHGFGFFCVSVALEHKGGLILGGVYDSLRDEFFFAQKNNGAYLNNKQIRVSDYSDIENALLCTGFTYALDTRMPNVKIFERFLQHVQAIRRTGSAALDLCYVAIGRFDGFWEMGLNPWDIAAGALIIKEAGGEITHFAGEQFSVYQKDVLASNGKIHEDMIGIINM